MARPACRGRPPTHVLEDEIGLKLLAPDKGWRRRGDMDPQFTRPFRASIVACARFIEDPLQQVLGIHQQLKTRCSDYVL
jgi:hypothetical protein